MSSISASILETRASSALTSDSTSLNLEFTPTNLPSVYALACETASLIAVVISPSLALLFQLSRSFCVIWRTLSVKCASNRSEEHTSELQSRGHLVCRLLLEKKNEHKYT